ncbi:MAG: PA14 domain-containing protein, partial [Fimbriimonas sp.]
MIALALIAATYVVGGSHVQQAYEPGISVRIFDIGQSMSNLMPLVSGQSPNIDVRVDSLDFAEGKFPSTAAFASKDKFVLEASGEIFAKTDGTYRFRLTSDDGSSLRIGDKELILNDGVHPAVAKTGEVTLKQGWHSFLVRYFESEGGERLLWEWAPPSGEFTTVGGDAVRVPKGITRVVSPGRKRLFRPGGDQRPGNGLPLDRLHPGFDLTTIRPAGFQPKVGAMAFLPDGRLLISNFEPHNDGVFDPNARDGKIFMLTGVTGKDPKKITVKQVAENLKDPLGLAVVKNPARQKGYSVYVTEQFQVTELEDTNGDDVFDKATCVGNGWKSDNYHQFTFGLVEKDGWLYGSLSTAIDFNAPGLSGPN